MMVEPDSNQTTQGWMIGFWVALLGTAMIVGAVVIRLTTAAITLSWFDVDPTSVDHAALGLLPSDRFGLDAIMLFGAALVFAGQFIRGRGAAWWILLLAALPIPVLLWHGWDDPADLEQGSLWIASVVAAVALAHGAGNSWLRATGLAILLAGLAPLVIKAIAQVAWDIPATIAYFDANRADVLAMRGLEPGSSAARVFERRLRNAVPTTWFSSTNLLASVLAAGASVWFAITLVAIREKVASGVSGLCAFIALAMAAIVIATGSLGRLGCLVHRPVFRCCWRVLPRLVSHRRMGGGGPGRPGVARSTAGQPSRRSAGHSKLGHSQRLCRWGFPDHG